MLVVEGLNGNGGTDSGAWTNARMKNGNDRTDERRKRPQNDLWKRQGSGAILRTATTKGRKTQRAAGWTRSPGMGFITCAGVGAR